MRRDWRALCLAAAGAVAGVFACGEDDVSQSAETTEAETTEAETTEAETTEAAGEGPAPVGREPRTEAERAAVASARDAAQHLGRTLKTRLMAAMAEGPGPAIRVCADEARELTARAAEERGARVGRSSTKLRNPENAGPEWVTTWLEAHGERPAQGVEPMSGIGGDPPVARFVGPIGLEGPCLMCHGDAEGIPEEVRSVLRERYPEDEATGYSAGDLRGAIWAEVPLDREE
jgi:hypothetical protein